jgi:hypothetical protein
LNVSPSIATPGCAAEQGVDPVREGRALAGVDHVHGREERRLVAAGARVPNGQGDLIRQTRTAETNAGSKE